MLQNENLQDEISDYRRQIEAQRETFLSRQDDDREVQSKMTSKNKLLNAALEENRVGENSDSSFWPRCSFDAALMLISYVFQNLSDDNVELRRKIDELQEEMRQGREEMEKAADEYLKHQHARREIDQELDRLRRQNEMLNDQVRDDLVMLTWTLKTVIISQLWYNTCHVTGMYCILVVGLRVASPSSNQG